MNMKELIEKGRGRIWQKPFLKNSARRELAFSILCGIAGLAGFILHFWDERISLAFYIASYLFGSVYMIKDVALASMKAKFEIDFLMLAAAIGAALLDRWADGALLLFLFSMGHSLEHYALDKARRSIKALATLAPKSALVRRDNNIVEIPIDDLRKGDIVIIKPNTKIAADGVVLKGSSSVDQSNITGESIPIEKEAFESSRDIQDIPKESIPLKNKVFSGTMNGQGYLEVEVTRDTNDTTLSHLIKLVNDAQHQESPTQAFTKKVEQVYVPAVLALVGTLNFAFLFINETFAESFYRAIVVLVVASPCALVISTPSAVLSGIARAARKGVLVKGGKALEQLGRINAIAFDKTGTLTRGEPRLTDIILLNNMTEKEAAALAVAVEGHSNHPIAKAIAKDGKERAGGQPLPHVSGFVSLMGRGVQAKYGNHAVVIGNKEIFKGKEDIAKLSAVSEKILEMEKSGKTAMLMKVGDDFEAAFAVMDTPREESVSVVKALERLGISRMVMLTGDNQAVADSVAARIGISEAIGNLLPENKVEAIIALMKQEKSVAMVGDGVNDAPAMANSSLGIAMGAAGSDVALETADVALMSDKIVNLPFALGLGRKTRKIIRQNLLISLGVILVMIPIALFGLTSIGPAVVIHEGSTLLVVFNALRLLKYDLQFEKLVKEPEAV